MRKLIIILIVLICGLVATPKNAFTQTVSLSDIFVTPNGDLSFFGGYVGGDGDWVGDPAGALDWSIGNRPFFGPANTDDLVISTMVPTLPGGWQNPANWFERMRITNEGNVGIGMTNPNVSLAVAKDQVASIIRSTTYMATGGFPGVFSGCAARGTQTSPSPLQAGDPIAAFAGVGFGTSGFVGPPPQAAMAFVAQENFTDTAKGTRIVFRTTPIGSTTLTSRMNIGANGNVGIGTTSPNSKLDVNGDINTSSVYKINDVTLLSNIGTNNIFVGVGAGPVNTGDENTFVGSDAGKINTTGRSNTFIGQDAGVSNTTGGVNTFIGVSAGHSNTTSFGNVFVGDDSGWSNTSGNGNTFIGQSAGASNTIGSGNVCLGFQAGSSETGSNKLYIANSSNNTLIYGDFSTGNIGVGTTNPTFPLQMGSGAHVTAGGVWTNASSRDYKENIFDLTIEDAKMALNDLRPKRYNYKVDNEDECLGFIAEDVPELVASKDRKSLSPMDIVAVLTKVVQEQQDEIDHLKAKNNQLSETLTTLTNRQDAIEDMLLALTTSPKEKLVKHNQAGLDGVQKTIQ